MTGKACATAFATRMKEETSRDDSAIKAINCCSDEVAVVYQPKVDVGKKELRFQLERESAFVISVNLASLNFSESNSLHDSNGKILMADLRPGTSLSFSSAQEWLHFYLPIAFVAHLREFNGEISGLYLRGTAARSNLEMQAMAATLVPILRHEKSYEPNFVENVVLAMIYLIIDRYVLERSTTSFERDQMASPTGRLLPLEPY